MTETDSESRADRRKRYEKVIRTVEYGGTIGLAESSARLSMVAHANMSLNNFERALQAALANGDLLRWEHPVSERMWLTPADEESLVALLEREAARDEPRASLIARANAMLAEIRD